MNPTMLGNLIGLRYKLMWANTRTRNGRIALFFAGYLVQTALRVPAASRSGLTACLDMLARGDLKAETGNQRSCAPPKGRNGSTGCAGTSQGY